MKVEDLKWIVYYHDFNGDEIRKFNIFNHGRFCEDVEKNFKKYKNKEEFAQHLKSDVLFLV